MKRNYDPPHSPKIPLTHLRHAVQWLRSALSPGPARHSSGQGFVEFALILPILLLVLLGIIEFSYVFATYSGMFNAAREGTRYGVVNPRDVSGIIGRAREKVFLADQAAVDIAVRYDNGPDSSQFTDPARVQIGDRVVVYITHDLPTITPVIQPIIPQLPIRVEATRTVVSLGEGVWNPTGDSGDDEDDESEVQGNAAIALRVAVAPQTVHSGEAVAFTYVITNTGDVALSNVTVVDDFGNCFTIADLAVGATETWNFTENIATTTTDHVTAAGADPQGGIASAADSVTVTVIGPALDVEVVAQPWTAYPGEMVHFTYVVTNTGDVDLTDVAIVDGLGTSTSPANVRTGASVFWEISYRLYETTINNATATGFDPTGNTVSNSDSALVQVVSDLDPIVIHEPLIEGSAMVTGTAHAGRTVYIRDLMSSDFPTPASDNTATQVDSSFAFTSLPPLVAGHVIVVEAYGEWDSAVVGGDFEPIVIGELCHGSDIVTGTAEPGKTVTLHIPETGYQNSTTIDANGDFTFTLSADQPLQAGQTVEVSGYGASATSTAKACTTNAYLVISPQCGPSGPTMITVNGYNWAYQNKNDDITLRWDGTDVSFFDADAEPADWEAQISVDATAGAHQVSAVNAKIPEIFAFFKSPCPAPDLVITDMTLLTPAPLATYQPLTFRVAVENQGTRPINNLFWVDLYASEPSPQATGIAWTAVSGLGIGDNTTLTITVQNGFEVTGTYTIWASADSWDQVSETDETNNDEGPIAVEITQEGEPPPPPPEGSGTIAGETWVSITGFPVPHGRTDVRCLDGEGQVVASTTSDDTAKYALSNLPAGTYTVIGETWIDGVRYSRTLDGVVVNDNETTVLLIILYRN